MIRKEPKKKGKPNLPKWYFWDCKYEEIVWEEYHVFIIGRVLERGKAEDWQELIRFYGIQTVLHVLKFETLICHEEIIEAVCNYFDLKPEETRAGSRKLIYKSTFP